MSFHRLATIIVFTALLAACSPAVVPPETDKPLQTPSATETARAHTVTLTATSTLKIKRTRLPTRVSSTQVPRPTFTDAPYRPSNTETPFPTMTPILVTPTPLAFQDLEPISLTNITRIQKFAQFFPATKEIRPYPPYAALSPDGRFLAYKDVCASNVNLWDLRTQRVVKTYPILTETSCNGDAWWDLNLAFSEDGSKLAMISPYGPQVWDVASGEVLLKSSVPIGDKDKCGPGTGLDQTYTDILFSPKGDKIITSSVFAGSSLTVWDIQTGKFLNRVPAYNNGIWELDLSRDGRFLVSTDRGGHVSFYDPLSGGEIKYPIESLCYEEGNCERNIGQVCPDYAAATAITSNGKILAVECGNDGGDFEVMPDCNIDQDQPDMPMEGWCGMTYLFSTETWKKIGTLKTFRHKDWGMDFNSDGGILAIAFDQPSYYIDFWDTRSHTKVHTLEGFPTEFMQVKFSEDGRF